MKPESSQSLPENESSRSQRTDTSGPSGDTTQLADMAHFYVSLQGERMSKPDASLFEKQTARRTREKMLGILSVLTEIEAEDNQAMPPEAAINTRLDRLPSEIPDEAARQQEQQKFLQALEFVQQKTTSPETSARFLEWQRQRQEGRRESVERQRQAKQQADTEQRQPEIQDAREKFFISHVLEQGGIAVFTDLPRELQGAGGGFGTTTEAKRRADSIQSFNAGISSSFAAESTHHTSTNLDTFYGERGIHEGVTFQPLVRTEYAQVEVPGAKRLFGREPSRMEPQATGQRQVKTSEVVQGGKDEPAVEMIYRTFAAPFQDQDLQYHCRDNRTGNVLAVSVVLPESVARELEQKGRTDPALIRAVAEQAVLQACGISEQAWKRDSQPTPQQPVRPPYEAWAAASAGEDRMYFQEPNAQGFDESRVVAFHA